MPNAAYFLINLAKQKLMTKNNQIKYYWWLFMIFIILTENLIINYY
jgi:hypothetical protein